MLCSHLVAAVSSVGRGTESVEETQKDRRKVPPQVGVVAAQGTSLKSSICFAGY